MQLKCITWNCTQEAAECLLTVTLQLAMQQVKWAPREIQSEGFWAYVLPAKAPYLERGFTVRAFVWMCMCGSHEPSKPNHVYPRPLRISWFIGNIYTLHAAQNLKDKPPMETKIWQTLTECNLVWNRRLLEGRWRNRCREWDKAGGIRGRGEVRRWESKV